MSTGLNCEFVERKAGEWFYVLEHDDAPKLSFDWREHASAFGPFPSCEVAEAHLFDNHANPGGFTVTPCASFVSDPVYDRLFERAAENKRRATRRRF